MDEGNILDDNGEGGMEDVSMWSGEGGDEDDDDASYRTSSYD